MIGKYDACPKRRCDQRGRLRSAPEKMAAELARMSRHPFMILHTATKAGPLLQAGEDDLNKVFMRIRAATGVDFTYYNRQRY